MTTTKHFLRIWDEAEELSFLVFGLNGETFAIEAPVVQEILDLVPMTAVPGAPIFVGGVINFRGKVIPAADIRLVFGIEPREPTIDSRIIVIELVVANEPTLIGIHTDRVFEVTTLSKSASEPPPSVGMRWPRAYVDCLVKRGGEFIVVPNLQAIFSGQREVQAVA